MTEKEKKEILYNFYLDNCVDFDKNEIPLSFNDWVCNHYEEEKQNIDIIT